MTPHESADIYAAMADAAAAFGDGLEDVSRMLAAPPADREAFAVFLAETAHGFATLADRLRRDARSMRALEQAADAPQTRRIH